MCVINKTLNKDLRELSFWLNTNKITLNVAKTEIILFKTSNKNQDADVKIKLCRKRIHASLCVIYLSVFIDENLSWEIHIYKISTKLIKSNAMLSKLRHFVNKDILVSVYYGIFHSYLAYLCLVWDQAKFSLNRITTTKESHQDITFCCLQGSCLSAFSQIQSFKICSPSFIRKLRICQ